MSGVSSLSTFPESIDGFKRYSDLNDTTMEKAEIYKSYIEAGEYETAEQYLNNNGDLAECGISADIINHHSDAIIALEENHLSFEDKLYNNSKLGCNTLSSSSGQIDLSINNKRVASMRVYGKNGIKAYSYQNGGQLDIELDGTEAAKQINKFYETETVIGTYMNKTLYQYVYKDSIHTETSTIDISSLGIKDLVEITGVASNIIAGIKQYYPLGSDRFNMYVNDTISIGTGNICNLNIQTNLELQNEVDIKVILKYTKD